MPPTSRDRDGLLKHYIIIAVGLYDGMIREKYSDMVDCDPGQVAWEHFLKLGADPSEHNKLRIVDLKEMLLNMESSIARNAFQEICQTEGKALPDTRRSGPKRNFVQRVVEIRRRFPRIQTVTRAEASRVYKAICWQFSAIGNRQSRHVNLESFDMPSSGINHSPFLIRVHTHECLDDADEYIRRVYHDVVKSITNNDPFHPPIHFLAYYDFRMDAINPECVRETQKAVLSFEIPQFRSLGVRLVDDVVDGPGLHFNNRITGDPDTKIYLNLFKLSRETTSWDLIPQGNSDISVGSCTVHSELGHVKSKSKLAKKKGAYTVPPINILDQLEKEAKSRICVGAVGHTFPITIKSYDDFDWPVDAAVIFTGKECTVKELVTLVTEDHATLDGKQLVTAADDADDELSVSAAQLPLRDPVTLERIAVPVRGRKCKHARCFDLLTYLEYVEKTRIWVCPICHQVLRFRDLGVDTFVSSILAATGSDDDAVVVDPKTGKWRLPSSSAAEKKRFAKTHFANPCISLRGRSTKREREATGGLVRLRERQGASALISDSFAPMGTRPTGERTNQTARGRTSAVLHHPDSSNDRNDPFSAARGWNTVTSVDQSGNGMTVTFPLNYMHQGRITQGLGFEGSGVSETATDPLYMSAPSVQPSPAAPPLRLSGDLDQTIQSMPRPSGRFGHCGASGAVNAAPGSNSKSVSGPGQRTAPTMMSNFFIVPMEQPSAAPALPPALAGTSTNPIEIGDSDLDSDSSDSIFF